MPELHCPPPFGLKAGLVSVWMSRLSASVLDSPLWTQGFPAAQSRMVIGRAQRQNGGQRQDAGGQQGIGSPQRIHQHLGGNGIRTNSQRERQVVFYMLVDAEKAADEHDGHAGL